MSEAQTAKTAVPAAHKPPPLPQPEKFEGEITGRPAGAIEFDPLAKPLGMERCRLVEHEDPGFWVCLESGTPYEEVFRPSFWANVVREKQFRVGQTIKVRNDEMTVFAELIIIEVGENRNWCRVGECYRKSIEDLVRSRPVEAAQEEYVARHLGPIEKWSVVRKRDGSIVRGRFESQAAAEGFKRDHEKRTGR